MDWIIGDHHRVYGEVQMMGVTGGEAYRWFVDSEGVVSMIPLDFLRREYTTPPYHVGQEAEDE